MPAAGGAASNTGGATPGTGGAAPSTGGSAPSTGGSMPTTGGTTASGGTPPATGGAPPAGTGGSADFDRCVALTQDNACTRCVCGPCQAQALACGAGTDAARNASCTAIVNCGMAQHCSSTDCYCGIGQTDLSVCQTAPAGPCMSEIQAAAGSSDFQTIANDLADTTHAINLANAVGTCAKQNCAGTCGL